jgi:plastocyanin
MPLTLPKTLLAAAAALVLVLAACTSTAGAAALPGAKISTQHFAQAATYPGLEHKHYEYGPINIVPGQNTIDFRPAGKDLKPSVPGYITSFRPNLIYSSSRTVPRVDVIHLHHGVWIMKGNPTFAAGEEKTTFFAPHGYGYHYDPHDQWILNYMLHNLTPTPTKVTITYDIDFLPDSEAAASSITPIHPMWLDVSGIKAYPVFNAIRGTGKNGKYTFPDMARGAEKRNVGPAHQWVVDKDLTLVGTGGHVHPGGLYTDLTATRNGKTIRLFRSQAKYFEPAGAVSWDVAMTVTKPNWRPTLKRGDLVDVHATYDISKASWYETMGIMVTWYADGTRPDGKDPFTSGVDTGGILTHGHLPENRNHGGSKFSGLPNPASLLSGPPTNNVNIRDFTYGRGDLSNRGRLPVVKRGHSLTFTNLDAQSGTPLDQAAYHTITACKSPCNRSTGIAYPVANGGRQFDSAELGYGPSFATAAANRNTWSTPKNLPRGTYTYFCRIHPFMRGAFRVK